MVTVFSAPDDGCCDTRNMYSDFAVNKCLHTVALSWNFLLTSVKTYRNFPTAGLYVLRGLQVKASSSTVNIAY